ncbi:unnamed protein product, partial [Closterium sp. NIES-54]
MPPCPASAPAPPAPPLPAAAAAGCARRLCLPLPCHLLLPTVLQRWQQAGWEVGAAGGRASAPPHTPIPLALLPLTARPCLLLTCLSPCNAPSLSSSSSPSTSPPPAPPPAPPRGQNITPPKHITSPRISCLSSPSCPFRFPPFQSSSPKPASPPAPAPPPPSPQRLPWAARVPARGAFTRDRLISVHSTSEPPSPNLPPLRLPRPSPPVRPLRPPPLHKPPSLQDRGPAPSPSPSPSPAPSPPPSPFPPSQRPSLRSLLLRPRP